MKKVVIAVIAVVLVLAVALSIYKLTGSSIVISGQLGPCSDSDNGVDLYTTGITGYDNRPKYTDECMTDFKIKEYYCTHVDMRVKSIKYHCDKGCVDGACVK